MGALEIILIIAGIAVLGLSFFIPTGEKNLDFETKKLIRKEVETAVNSELGNIHKRMEEMTDESINNAMEKTERSLERISNEKIIAVNDFSESVLNEIDKSHKEAVFLYDMLNDKHKDIKNTITKVEQQVKRAKDLEESEKEVKTPETKSSKKNKKDAKTSEKASSLAEIAPIEAALVDSAAAQEIKKEMDFKQLHLTKVDNEKIIDKPNLENISDREKILAMHHDGKSDIEIAIALGRGIGEVKLVIELFEGVKNE